MYANQRPSQRISYPKKIAGIDFALADLVDWLARDLATGGGSPVGTPPGTESGSRRSQGSPEPLERVVAAQSAGAVSGTARGLASADVRSLARTGPSISGPVVNRVEQLGNVLAERTLKDIERAYAGPVPREVKVALADHFWCSPKWRTCSPTA
ncbi:hypothetical protein [Amycolatopsis sp. NPDC021455]|uniref:hypothetical protein n=1 Tax=Amycolatopsis sp. NPDC021455 TaxID=3154901 RepID=UPI0033F9971C